MKKTLSKPKQMKMIMKKNRRAKKNLRKIKMKKLIRKMMRFNWKFKKKLRKIKKKR